MEVLGSLVLFSLVNSGFDEVNGHSETGFLGAFVNFFDSNLGVLNEVLNESNPLLSLAMFASVGSVAMRSSGTIATAHAVVLSTFLHVLVVAVGVVFGVSVVDESIHL